MLPSMLHTAVQMLSLLFLCRKLLMFLGKFTKKLLLSGLLFFGSDMHQIVCRMGTLPQTPLGSLPCSLPNS